MVDTSAVVAIVSGEPIAAELADALGSAATRIIAAPTVVELGIVLEARYGPAGASIVERFLRDSDLDVIAFSRLHVDRAMEGWRRYGKGRHRAALNLGDCFTYGLAVASNMPILCTGEDFAQTDADVVARPAG